MAISKVVFGGTTLMDITDTTAVASDVASGKYFYTADGAKTLGTASGGGGVDVEALSVTQNGTYTAPTGKAYSPVTVNVAGGGGASNLVMGTFTGTTTGAAMDIDLPYTGNGYPIAVMVFPKEGTYKSGGTYYNLIQRYAANFYTAIKNDPSTAPIYSGNIVNQNFSAVYQYRKNSASSATSYGGTGTVSAKTYTGSAAVNNNSSGIVNFKSNTKMSVYIASTSYGFAANIEYTYIVVYSE